MEVKLIWITPDAEKLLAYIARVSNPANQDNPNIAKLLRYCMDEGHWSVFDMANVCIEVTTSRAITAQIARHWSMKLQEFSQRYAEVMTFEPAEARRQDVKDRQNSIDDLPDDVKAWWDAAYDEACTAAGNLYRDAIGKGIAKECARMVLPMSSTSKIYMNGTIRSWIHYLALRTDRHTQKEHREVAEAIRKTLIPLLPIVAEAAGWVQPQEIVAKAIFG